MKTKYGSYKVIKGFTGRLCKNVRCSICKSPMVKRKTKKDNSDFPYWFGCSKYPKCKGQLFVDRCNQRLTWDEIRDNNIIDYDDLDYWNAWSEIFECGDR